MSGHTLRVLSAVTLALAIVVGFQNCSNDVPAIEMGANYASAHPPEFAVSKSPSPISASSTSTFEFAGQAPDVTFSCSLDNQPFSSCVSPLVLSGLSDGVHRLVLRARNALSSAEQVFEWSIDRTAPTVNILTSLSSTNQRNVSINFASADQGPSLISYQCKLDTAAFAPCSSPYAAANLIQGTHTLQIKGTDAVGNVSAVASISFVIDLTAPTFPTYFVPEPVNYVCDASPVSAVFTFAGNDTGGSGLKSVTCKYDAGAEGPCVSPQIKTISSAEVTASTSHTMVIKAYDNAGNSTTTTRTFRYEVTFCDPGGGNGGP